MLKNQYLTIKELKETLPEVPENSLKRYLHEHKEYLNFKKEHNRYKIHVSEIETLKLIRKYYSDGFKREEVNAKLEESSVPMTIAFDLDNSSLVSVNNELSDMKKLISFLVQQNEQCRLQQNKIKDQNAQLIREIQGLKHLVEEYREAQYVDYERETDKAALLLDGLLATQKSIAKVASSVEAKKSKYFWRKLLGKYIRSS